MRHFHPIVLVSLALVGVMGHAEEPAQEFLEALRSRGLYDEALDYLDTLSENRTLPASFLETLLFERGITRIQGAKRHKSSEKKNEWLAEGQKLLQKFVAEHQNHPLASQARMQDGNAGVERARLTFKKTDTSAGDARALLLLECRRLYGEAQLTFESTAVTAEERLKAFPAKVTDPKELDERERLRMDLLQSRLLVAATSEELADTCDKGSVGQKEALTGASERYAKIYQDYRTRLAGLYARMYQARCQQKLGNHKESLVLLEQLLENPDEPEAMHSLRVKAVALAADSWMAEKQYQKILDAIRPIVDGATEVEAKSSEFLELQVKLALAAKALVMEQK